MKYIIIYIYIAINTFLLIVNWPLFSSSINVDLGMGVYNLPPIILTQVIGLISLIIFAITDGIKDLKSEVAIGELQKRILSLEKESVVNVLKEKNKAIIAEEKNNLTTS